jgi:peptidylprolyl isomerase
MKQAKQGDIVKVHVTEKEIDGSVIDSTKNSEPLKIKLGEIKLLKGLQDAIVGMKPSEQKTIQLAPDRAYGDYQRDLHFEIDRNALPKSSQVTKGDELYLQDDSGDVKVMKIIDILDKKVILDGNHPLAGKELKYDIQLVDIES